ncbi:transcriptional regulator with PAS, ATPase and Fis domain [Sedimentibacter acidaminivorans]|uniref:Transcriptional regulator with PAS, ATPase and Fis domain n=1 Tax=Sedimentibacter acidaminivorans TaxID=913099 RepID=A0ABS4GCU1_9FIRM|nr:sigma 54-interacting transcriptional regulator [Sedimentibacter acidaminivorans]MBP1925511.1 transcriptional regulator with PAS, ATPase and Fis domain [Sedimentibacter acidaminivorans]
MDDGLNGLNGLNIYLFNTVLDSIKQSLCIVDNNCVVKYWNTAAETFYSINKEEITGKDVRLFFPDALLPKVIKEQHPFEDVYNSPKKDYYIVISAAPLYDSNNNLIGGISLERDITDYMKITKLLEKTTDNLTLLKQEIHSINHNKYSFSKIIGNNEKFKKTVELCKNISNSNINILILGDSGTGKEVIARSVHTQSNRKGPFIPFNCSAIPYSLFESELFGYEGGAFTGADKKGKIGKIEAANKGTVFLDEIGDMPLDMQPKFLRVLEDGIINRLGGYSDIKLDIRIIGATNKNLKELVSEGKFRQDLYYRLSSVVVELPSLKERKDDIELFVYHFLKSFCMQYGVNIPEIPGNIMNILVNYRWDGNIRELKNVIERIVIMLKSYKTGKIILEFLPEYIYDEYAVFEPEITDDIGISDLNTAVTNAEKKAILMALKRSKGNITKATKILNIPRTSLYYKLRKYNISMENKVISD